MNKISKLLLVLLLGFIFVPMVYAEELPKTGVTYFLMYPDGSEEVTENYNEAIKNEEKLIYSGTTNENGEVPIRGWNSEGTIRVVQTVPDGYTTTTKEITVDLSKGVDASFVDYRGLGNPKTGRSLLFIAVVAGVAGITIASRKNKKSLMIIPVVLAFTVAAGVKAAGTYPCIKVKDGNGNALSGVKIEIYAKPTVEAAPAIKLDANGGHFLDGKTVMYVRIPNNGCTMDDVFEYIGNEETNYIEDNKMGAYYQDGYYPNGFEYPSTVSNGDVVYLTWEEDSEAELLRIVGNGGTYNFYGEELTELVIYTEDDIDDFLLNFENGDNYFVGTDTTAACSNYSSTGIYDGPIYEDVGKIDSISQTYYLCWNQKPDGIYVNG